MWKPKYSRMLSKMENGQQPCWYCKKACSGECEWSKYFLPVPGWIAHKTTVNAHISENIIHEYETYDIDYCPKFSYDGLCSSCRYCPKEQKENAKFADICPRCIGPINTCNGYRHWKYGFIYEE